MCAATRPLTSSNSLPHLLAKVTPTRKHINNIIITRHKASFCQLARNKSSLHQQQRPGQSHNSRRARPRRHQWLYRRDRSLLVTSSLTLRSREIIKLDFYCHRECFKNLYSSALPNGDIRSWTGHKSRDFCLFMWFSGGGG